jgi:hypothetical protein
MVVMSMTILTPSNIYSVVFWTTESYSHNELQMAFMTSFLVINVVINATFWLCDLLRLGQVHPIFISLSFSFNQRFFSHFIFTLHVGCSKCEHSYNSGLVACAPHDEKMDVSIFQFAFERNVCSKCLHNNHLAA